MSNATTSEITRAVPTDRDRLGETLAQAFHDDPVFAWVVPDGDARAARLPSLFAAFADVFLPHRETYVTADGAGAALWAPPGQEPVPADQAEAFGERLAEILGDHAERAGQLQALLDEHHPRQPCFYLQFMGVRPERQGRGLGGRLLTTVLARCDAEGTPGALEATSPANRRLYERHGFRTVDELAVPGGPPLWAMWREAGAPDG